MGNSVVSEEQKEWLEDHFLYQCWRSAGVLVEADYLVLNVGAGFSADSGLAVYKDIANIEAYHRMNVDYADLCTTHWLDSDREIFFGFWGKCFNDYKETTPHEGYNIIKKWKETYFTAESPDLQPFFIYSSNVDGHPQRMGFKEDEIYEIHGSIEDWQCQKPNQCPSGKKIWKAPENLRFLIDTSSMRAKDGPIECSNYIPCEGFASNHPKCLHCDRPGRPNILMFGDQDWFSKAENENRYAQWRYHVLEQCRKGKKLVILEIGCGVRVPTVRSESERFFGNDVKENVTLIRINPDYPLTAYSDNEEYHTIEIQSRGLHAVQQIDKFIRGEVETAPEAPETPLPKVEQKESTFERYQRYIARGYASGSDEEIEFC